MRLSGTRTRYRNWLNRRAWERGKTPLTSRIARQFTSRMPVYRNRINRGTGSPRRDDLSIGRTGDRAMAEYRARRDRTDARAAANRQFVRETLAQRDPQYARVVDRAARDVARTRTRPVARSGRTRLWSG
jgi:hypothetical protein